MFIRAIFCAVLAVNLTAANELRPLGVYLQRSYSHPDLIEWERVKNSDDVQSLQSFVSRYPTSRYLKAAERRLEQIQPAPETAVGPCRKLVEDSKYVVRAVPAASHER